MAINFDLNALGTGIGTLQNNAKDWTKYITETAPQEERLRKAQEYTDREQLQKEQARKQQELAFNQLQAGLKTNPDMAGLQKLGNDYLLNTRQVEPAMKNMIAMREKQTTKSPTTMDLFAVLKATPKEFLPLVASKLKSQFNIQDSEISQALNLINKPAKPENLTDTGHLQQALMESQDPTKTPEERAQAKQKAELWKQSLLINQQSKLPPVLPGTGQVLEVDANGNPIAKNIGGYLRQEPIEKEKDISGNYMKEFDALQALNSERTNPQTKFSSPKEYALAREAGLVDPKELELIKNRMDEISPSDEFKDAEKRVDVLRSSMKQNKAVKDAELVYGGMQTYKSLKASALRQGPDSAAAGITLLYQFMKNQDGSVVRPSEFALVHDIGSLWQRVKTAYARYVKGGQVAPEAFVKSLDDYYRAIYPWAKEHADKIVDGEFDNYRDSFRSQRAKEFVDRARRPIKMGYQTIRESGGLEPQGLLAPNDYSKPGSALGRYSK